jgi:hypothetical protein
MQLRSQRPLHVQRDASHPGQQGGGPPKNNLKKLGTKEEERHKGSLTHKKYMPMHYQTTLFVNTDLDVLFRAFFATVARCICIPKIPTWVYLGLGMVNVGIFDSHLVHLTFIWYILWSFGAFFPFWKKSGNHGLCPKFVIAAEAKLFFCPDKMVSNKRTNFRTKNNNNLGLTLQGK